MSTKILGDPLHNPCEDMRGISASSRIITGAIRQNCEAGGVDPAQALVIYEQIASRVRDVEQTCASVCQSAGACMLVAADVRQGDETTDLRTHALEMQDEVVASRRTHAVLAAGGIAALMGQRPNHELSA